jgi:hypothetical protein
VPQNFLYPHRDQQFLMPLDMRDWLPEDDRIRTWHEVRGRPTRVRS